MSKEKRAVYFQGNFVLGLASVFNGGITEGGYGMDNEEIKEAVLVQLETEFNQFRSGVLGEDKLVVFERAYEITVKQGIASKLVDYLAGEDKLLKFLFNFGKEHNLVNSLYDVWITSAIGIDYNLLETIRLELSFRCGKENSGE